MPDTLALGDTEASRAGRARWAATEGSSFPLGVSWVADEAACFYLRGVSEDDDDLYVMINTYWRALTFTVQEADDRTWKRVIDTSVASPLDFCEPGREVSVQSRAYTVGPRSVVVLIRRRDDRR